jgi:hypothetical protein
MGMLQLFFFLIFVQPPGLRIDIRIGPSAPIMDDRDLEGNFQRHVQKVPAHLFGHGRSVSEVKIALFAEKHSTILIIHRDEEAQVT